MNGQNHCHLFEAILLNVISFELTDGAIRVIVSSPTQYLYDDQLCRRPVVQSEEDPQVNDEEGQTLSSVYSCPAT